ncbi:MAG: hypothetical protein ACI87A_002049, partial [Planctomycetota bacterium]
LGPARQNPRAVQPEVRLIPNRERRNPPHSSWSAIDLLRHVCGELSCAVRFRSRHWRLRLLALKGSQTESPILQSNFGDVRGRPSIGDEASLDRPQARWLASVKRLFFDCQFEGKRR